MMQGFEFVKALGLWSVPAERSGPLTGTYRPNGDDCNAVIADVAKKGKQPFDCQRRAPI